MQRQIKKAAVLGAGVMGATIAAHLANAGIPCYLLDIVPNELTEEEKKKGLSLEHPAVRNRFAVQGRENALKARPAAFFVPENADLITIGNFEDNLPWIKEADWIIEVVVERLEVKQRLLERVEQFRKPGSIVSSNTSGIPIRSIAEGRSPEFRQHFLGTHFFNPPRYMRLLEIIPTPDTLPEIVEFMADFGRRALGKGAVMAKDTPNFIANRIGVHGLIVTLRAMAGAGLSVEEVDAITGPAMGRPRSASFRTLDLVGLDTFLHVARNVRESVQDPAEKEEFAVPEFLEKMAAERWLGDKTGQGFYKKVSGPKGKEYHSLDWRTLEYRPQQKAVFASLEAARQVSGTAAKLKTLIQAKDRAGEFAWSVLKRSLLYTAARIPEIADDIVNVDQAMRWGFNWELGPFEVWDAIGLAGSVERMRQEGETLPPIVERLLAAGGKSFYLKKEGVAYYFDLASGDYRPVREKPDVLFLPDIKARRGVVKENAGASLIDLGDGVACLEFHTKSNALGTDVIEMVRYSVEEISKNFEGLVLANHGKNFSVGANLMLMLMEAQDENWDDIELMVRQFQEAGMLLKYSSKPTVAAPHQMALGGGCEVCLGSDRIQASAETYIGLVEVGVGLIPAGGGTKELLLRNMARAPRPLKGSSVAMNVDLQPFVSRAFETIAMAKVSTSAQEARTLGYMRPGDGITMAPDRLIHDAKQVVLEMARAGYRPPQPQKVEVLGEQGYAGLQMLIHNMQQGGYISEYDAHIARKLARILTGGSLTSRTVVGEQYLLDLEREAFMSLLGERKTQERMGYMLANGKPLRN